MIRAVGDTASDEFDDATTTPGLVPLALATWHQAHPVGAVLRARLQREHARDVMEGAGFAVEQCAAAGKAGERLDVVGRRLRTLPDFVVPELRLLVVGLNPSLYAADAGVGFARPGNRFWPAALRAGLVTRERDPWHAVHVDRIGMTDLVKRATTTARDVTPTEYRAGFDRVTRLVGWIQPGAVCFAGLAGWRVAVDRKASAGLQPGSVAGAPVYVMPNPSGLNAHDTVATLSDHLRAAMGVADDAARARQAPRSSRARAATFSGVNPNSRITRSPGADAP